MSANLFTLFRKLIPSYPLQVGTVQSISGGVATLEMPGGGLLQARGAATVGQLVFVQDGVIQGVAPSLTVELIDV